jgi:Putative endonuclease, protein of unknown function (DUF1780)
MSDEEFLEDRRRALKESVEYFSSANKAAREEWVCTKFLASLSLYFEAGEVLPQTDDPPDVMFRDARFEIKEILNLGRRRHAEYKQALAKALVASSPAELFQPFTPEDITPGKIGTLILPELAGLTSHYEPRLRASLDLLFYVNLTNHFFKMGPMPNAELFSGFGWRSISVLEGQSALVFYAASNAPDFLRAKMGAVTLRRSE